MSVGVGFMLVPASGDPCAAAPSFSSIGTPTKTANGNCGATGITIETTVTLNAALPAGYSVQRQYYFGTSSVGTPNSGWNTMTFTGSSETLVHEFGAVDGTTDSLSGFGSLGTHYYQVRFRIVGSDGSTVCATSDNSTRLTVGTVYACFE